MIIENNCIQRVIKFRNLPVMFEDEVKNDNKNKIPVTYFRT